MCDCRKDFNCNDVHYNKISSRDNLIVEALKLINKRLNCLDERLEKLEEISESDCSIFTELYDRLEDLEDAFYDCCDCCDDCCDPDDDISDEDCIRNMIEEEFCYNTYVVEQGDSRAIVIPMDDDFDVDALTYKSSCHSGNCCGRHGKNLFND